MHPKQVSDDDILALLARIDDRYAESIRMDIECLLRRVIGGQIDLPAQWITRDCLRFGDAGVMINLEDGVPMLTLGHEYAVDLSEPVEVRIGHQSVRIDLMSEIRQAWHWLQWTKFDRVPWKRKRG